MKLLALLAASVVGACVSTPDSASRMGRTTRAPDGVEIVYDDAGHGDTTLVFIHCWAGDRTFWHREFERFADRYRVVKMDLPGHGESGDGRATWSVMALAADVEKLVRELALDRVILIGHSMGGPIALEAAHRLDGRVIGVVGVDTLHDAEIELTQVMADQIAHAFETDFDAAMAGGVAAMLPGSTRTEASEWILTKARQAHRGPVIALLRDFPNVDVESLFRNAGVPIRCINKEPFSDHDVATAVEKNRRYCDFDAVIMKDVGHYPMIEKPEEFDAKLEAVVQALDRAGRQP